MRIVADMIERRHAGAVEVRLTRRRETDDGVRRLVPAGNHVATVDNDVSVDDLVYYTISPDYCLPDKALGSVGTRHRYTSLSLVKIDAIIIIIIIKTSGRRKYFLFV